MFNQGILARDLGKIVTLNCQKNNALGIFFTKSRHEILNSKLEFKLILFRLFLKERWSNDSKSKLLWSEIYTYNLQRETPNI